MPSQSDEEKQDYTTVSAALKRRVCCIPEILLTIAMMGLNYPLVLGVVIDHVIGRQ